MKILLTTLNQETIVVDENYKFRAQHIYVEEALAAGLSLDEMINDVDDFLDNWVSLEDDIEFGWGEVIESGEGIFTVIEDDLR